MSKVAACIGAHPGIAFGVSALITIAISMIALVVGEFEVSADNAGWESRTTTMANRQVQFRALQDCYTLNKDCWAGTLGTPSRRLHTPNMPENAEATATVTVPKPSTLRKRRLSNTEPSTSEYRRWCLLQRTLRTKRARISGGNADAPAREKMGCYCSKGHPGNAVAL